MFKNWLISLGYFFGCFLIGSLIITILNYFNIFSNNIISILKIVIPIVSIGISGFVMGSHSKERGYLSGIKIGATVIIIFVIISFLFDKFEIRSILYYVILILSAILSSMFGINIKKN